MAASLISELHKKSNSLECLATPPSHYQTRPQSISCDPSVSRPALLDPANILESSENGVCLLSYRQNTQDLGSSRTRWHSDTDLASNPYHAASELSVNKVELDINDEQESVTIHWDIKTSVSAKDWIGLYRTGKTVQQRYTIGFPFCV